MKKIKTNMPIWWYSVIFAGIVFVSLFAEWKFGEQINNMGWSSFITFSIFFVVLVIYIESGTFRSCPDMWFKTEKTDRIFKMFERWEKEAEEAKNKN
jgi:hypothetical protein